MTLSIPAVGDRIVQSHAANVIGRLNRQIQLAKTADQASNDGTNWTDVTDLTFPVVNGRQYGGTIRGSYAVTATNQGLQLRITCPAGSVLVHVTTYGQGGSPNGSTISRLAASGDATSISATDAVGTRAFTVEIMSYQCTADGTFAVGFRRGGTSGSTGATIHKGANGLILANV